MKYTFEKHLEYANWLFAQDKSQEDICNDLVSKWALDDKMDDILADDSAPEVEIFNLALCCAGRGCDDDREEVFKKIVRLINKALVQTKK